MQWCPTQKRNIFTAKHIASDVLGSGQLTVNDDKHRRQMFKNRQALKIKNSKSNTEPADVRTTLLNTNTNSAFAPDEAITISKRRVIVRYRKTSNHHLKSKNQNQKLLSTETKESPTTHSYVHLNSHTLSVNDTQYSIYQ